MTLVLLGPQRRPSLRPVMRSLDVEGPVAVVTAGWRHREDEDGELLSLLDGRGVNLGLYRRWLDATHHDHALSEWEADRQVALEELSSVYGLRLHHALQGLYALQRRRTAVETGTGSRAGAAGRAGSGPRAGSGVGAPGHAGWAGPLGAASPDGHAPSGDGEVIDAAIDDATAEVRRLDEWFLDRVAEVRELFAERLAGQEHPRLAEHRRRVAELFVPTRTLVVAGGHVGVILDCLRLFDVDPRNRAVVAWSAGAMALAGCVVLFHDFATQGYGHPEMHDRGLGVLHRVVPLPHARRRLRLDDRSRTSVLARRALPARCLVLDDGVRVDVGPAGQLPAGARVLDVDGRVRALEGVAV